MSVQTVRNKTKHILASNIMGAGDFLSIELQEKLFDTLPEDSIDNEASLAERLDRAERRARSLRVACVVLAVSLAGSWVGFLAG